MVWFKVDDNLPFHEKVVKAGNPAMGLWVRAGAWSAWQLSDGFVPDHIATTLGTRAQAKRLVDVILWTRESGGYRFHQWNEDGRQPTRASVEKERAQARDRMQKAREAKRSGSGEVQANTTPNADRTSGEVRVTRPDPTRPDLTTEVQGGSHVSSGTTSAPPAYPDHCPDHAADSVPPPCGGCMKQKRLNAETSRPLTLVPSSLRRCIVHDTSFERVCNGCEADRKAAESA